MFHVQNERWGARRATAADNARLCELVRSIHMKGKLDVTQERDPDFFALGRMHLGPAETWAFLDGEGSIEGCWSLCLRDALLDGQRVKTGYLCDLRLTPKLRGGKVLGEASIAFMRHAREVYGVELFYNVVFDSNSVARGALTTRSEKRRLVAVHTPMTPFEMTSVQITTPRPAPGRRITRARASEAGEIADFLRRDQESRPLGYLLDEALLDARFRTWPGFGPESFFLSRDARGRVDGCLAPWNTAPFKRTRVLGYHGEMRLVRAGYDLAARLRGFRKLPAPGECFDYSFLTHLAVKDDDPAILKDLLLAAYTELYPTGQHFLSAMVPRGSRLAEAFRGFQINRTAMTLYSVAGPDSPWSQRDLRTLRPGFEMALT
ncbi:MAG TPA: hypothetical protein VGI39_44915 [Polyangiaceae bacterium]|jgi:hypothetical protein